MFCLVWFGLVWFGLVWFGLVWFGLVWFGLVWFWFWFWFFCFVLFFVCLLLLLVFFFFFFWQISNYQDLCRYFILLLFSLSDLMQTFLICGEFNWHNYLCYSNSQNVLISGKVFDTPPCNGLLFFFAFAPTWIRPENSQFKAPTLNWPDYILHGPDQTRL